MDTRQTQSDRIPLDANPINTDYQHEFMKEATQKTSNRQLENNEFEKRATTILKQLHESSITASQALSDLERRIEKMFSVAKNKKIWSLLREILEPSSPTNLQHTSTNRQYDSIHSKNVLQTSETGIIDDPSEPADRFVQVSRNLQSDKSLGGYTNYKEASRSRTYSYSHTPTGEQSIKEALLDSKALLAAAAIGLAFALLPSSSPVPRSLFGRTWPHLIQLGLATLIHIRKRQDAISNEQRSNSVLYIGAAIIQLLSALRDWQGHSLVSFTSSALFGPLAPLAGLIKQIIVSIPNFLLRTVFLSGISLVGKVTVFLTLAVAIVVAIGVLIVTAAEYV